MSIRGFRHFLVTEAALAALAERAEKHDVPVEVLQEVFDRGVVAWDDSTNKTPDQYAFNRVDSFLSGGFAAKLDSDLLEVSAALVHKYTNGAEKSVHNLEDGPYDNHNDTKAFKRKMFLNYAKRKLRKEESNVVDTSGEELKEGTPIELTKLVAMHRRDTRQQKVMRKYNERRHAMRDFHRTENALNQNFHKRKDNDSEFIDRHRHQKTNRWNTQKRQRVAAFRDAEKHKEKMVGVKESAEYIEARKKLHDAHHESARLHAGMERDPELRRLDLHRAKRHKHASRVLEILQATNAKKKKQIDEPED